MRILLIEDDAQLGRAILQGLRQQYTADWFCSAEEGSDALAANPYDVIVLDINLPGISGMEWLLQLRKRQNPVPVLLLTAHDTLQDRVNGLDGGADDYVVKPFDFDELLARIRALARRRHVFHPYLLQAGEVTLDTLNKLAFLRDTELGLSQKEFDILRLLIERCGHCVSKQRIEQHLYSWDDEIGSNAIEAHISRLRRKLGSISIRTIRNLGYKLELPA